MMLFFSLLMASVFIGRIVWPLKVKKPVKILLSGLVIVITFKFYIIKFFGGPMFFAPDLPPWILITASLLYAILFIGFFLLLIAEIIAAAAKLCGKPIPAAIIGKIRLVLFFTAVILAFAGIFNGTKPPQIKQITLTFPNLPEQSENLKIAVLADLHVDNITREPEINAIVQRVNVLKPDAVFILGDFVDGTTAKRGQDLAGLSKLRSKYGTFAVPGNHEYFSGYAEWMDFFANHNITMLKNRHTALPCGIYLAGVTDRAAEKYQLPMPDVAGAVAGIPAGSFTILLSHRPDNADAAAANKIDLQFSGHTHGGMIRGLDLIVAALNSGFVSGLYRVSGTTVYVSNGTTIWNGFPVRLGVPAEITLVTLQKH